MLLRIKELALSAQALLNPLPQQTVFLHSSRKGRRPGVLKGGEVAITQNNYYGLSEKYTELELICELTQGCHIRNPFYSHQNYCYYSVKHFFLVGFSSSFRSSTAAGAKKSRKACQPTCSFLFVLSTKKKFK